MFWMGITMWYLMGFITDLWQLNGMIFQDFWLGYVGMECMGVFLFVWNWCAFGCKYTCLYIYIYICVDAHISLWRYSGTTDRLIDGLDDLAMVIRRTYCSSCFHGLHRPVLLAVSMVEDAFLPSLTPREHDYGSCIHIYTYNTCIYINIYS